MKSILDQLVGTSQHTTRLNTLTYGDLKEMVAKLPELKEGEDDPYAILLSQDKFEMLIKSKHLVAFDNSSPTEKVVSCLYGLPVIIQKIYEYKVVTRKEYKEFYNLIF
ncbi:hypothetical protein ACNPQK_08420 [Acinetobacter guillouiae]|uniref:hypothetical protein n=1 Tax=Acinetobacter guillouiae TaxID=106649 RepID=UPI003AF967F0